MTVDQIASLVSRYATARAGQFRRQDFITWAVHHGLSRETPAAQVDAAILASVGSGEIERVPGAEAEVHPLFRATLALTQARGAA